MEADFGVYYLLIGFGVAIGFILDTGIVHIKDIGICMAVMVFWLPLIILLLLHSIKNHADFIIWKREMKKEDEKNGRK